MTTVSLRMRYPGGYEALPEYIQRLWERLGRAEDPVAAFERSDGTVVGTRRRARELIEAHPGITADQVVTLDASEIEVAGSPFLSELLKAWPLAQLDGANEDVRATWEIVVEPRQEGAA